MTQRVLTALAHACLAALWLVAGCGDDPEKLPGEEIDCTWFAKDNCWRQSLATATGCLPAVGTHGVLAADGGSCTYADGYEVVFHTPVDLRTDLNNLAWDFSTSRDGQACAAWSEPNIRLWVLGTALGEFRQYGSGYEVGITCPNGLQYKVPNPGLLTFCNPLDMPTRRAGWDATGVTFTLSGTGTDGVLRLFDCRVGT
jgi:hypothetical protein